jgi:hypothetical protein
MRSDGLTITLLSCGRFDLLRLTVESTLRAMSHPIDEILVTEDSGLPDARQRLHEIFAQFSIPTRYFIHKTRRGIISSMDELYRSVRTPYILHLEDDWVCTAVQPDFVERSILILSNNPKILQVWLRPPHDCGGHPLEDGIMKAGPARCRLLTTSYQGIWHGYSNNPNMRRTQDYLLLPGGYASCEVRVPASGIRGTLGSRRLLPKRIATSRNSFATEARIGEFYFRKGFIAAVLCEPDGGFVHIGASRSVDRHLWESSINLSRRFDVLRRRAIEMRAELETLRRAQRIT